MSDRKANLTFTPRARKDHWEVILYSLEMWGPDQMDRYEATLDDAVKRVHQFPELGRDCTRLVANGRWIQAGHDMIYYTFVDGMVSIHRILHERRRVTAVMLTEPDE